MNVEVRNINGVRGFCIYKGGVPYTYIYTRDAINMLGLIDIRGNYKRLRIRRFGEYFETVLQNTAVSDQPIQVAINITPNYAISQDQSTCATCVESTFHTAVESTINKPWRPSKYDSILPEFILDRVIFAIANIMNSKTARQFRFELFNTIIPHFQQTATQEQISKVPILNTTSQFMYDNSNIKFVSQQAYNFNHQVIFSHVNRFAILTEETNLDAVFEKLFNGFQDALHETDINIYDEVMKVVEVRKSVNPYRTPEITKQDIIDTLICNVRLHNLFINFVSICIREVEKQILLKQNGQAIKQKWNEETGYDDDVVEYDDGLKHPVEFTSLDERAGQNPLQEETLRDYIPNVKRDTSWIY
jgi:hypothetical protein